MDSTPEPCAGDRSDDRGRGPCDEQPTAAPQADEYDHGLGSEEMEVEAPRAWPEGEQLTRGIDEQPLWCG